MGKAIVLVLLVAGCGARQFGPDAATTNEAMQIAWSQAMAMPMNQAPTVIWLDASACDHQIADNISDLDNCVEDAADSRGSIEVVWRDSFSGSKFARALVKYRSWITIGAFTADTAMIDDANHALVAAGM